MTIDIPSSPPRDPRGAALDLPPVPVGVAPNGARRGRSDHPAIPLTAADLADCARSCAAAGASWFHVHVRDDEGGHTLDAGRYREAFAAIRASVGDALVLQMSTESVGRYGPDEQMDAVRAVQPEAVSLAVRELLAGELGEPAAVRFVNELIERGTALQFIVYDTADVHRLAAVDQRAGGFLGCPEVLLVLGSYAAGRAGRAGDLLPLLSSMPPGWRWSACAFGAGERVCLAAAAALGGGVRTGFENNLWQPDGLMAADNATLVSQVVAAIGAMGLRPADVAVTRARFGLPPDASPPSA